MKKQNLVYGVGINDADYPTSNKKLVNGRYKLAWVCPFYKTWVNMLKRCYSKSYHQTRPTYRDCSVSPEWFTFSTFKTWMEAQDWQGKQLDKDLLIKQNKIYSPDTCIFVTGEINKFTTDSAKTRGEYLIGVSFYKTNNNFVSTCRNPFTNKKECLGYFTSELEAHQAWKNRKHELACQLANSKYCNSSRLAEALQSRYL